MPPDAERSDTAKIILSPALPGFEHTTDSVIIKADCGHDSWIAPVSKAAVDNPELDTVTVCFVCFAKDPEGLDALIKQGGAYVFPGQREELINEVGEEETDWAFRMTNAREVELRRKE